MLFRNEYYFLSNMFKSDIKIPVNGTIMCFTCVEAAFQAMKCPKQADKFIGLDGYTAKKLGRTVPLRPDWEDVKENIMLHLLRRKFMCDNTLKTKLRNVTGEIVEENTWNDTYWGKCNGVGKNILGQLLMKVRDEIVNNVSLYSKHKDLKFMYLGKVVGNFNLEQVYETVSYSGTLTGLHVDFRIVDSDGDYYTITPKNLKDFMPLVDWHEYSTIPYAKN